MKYINCFVFVVKVLLRLTIKNLCFCFCVVRFQYSNSASMRRICKWHCTKYCGTVFKDLRENKTPSAQVFISSKISNGPSASIHETYLMSFSK